MKKVISLVLALAYAFALALTVPVFAEEEKYYVMLSYAHYSVSFTGEPKFYINRPLFSSGETVEFMLTFDRGFELSRLFVKCLDENGYETSELVPLTKLEAENTYSFVMPDNSVLLDVSCQTTYNPEEEDKLRPEDSIADNKPQKNEEGKTSEKAENQLTDDKIKNNKAQEEEKNEIKDLLKTFGKPFNGLFATSSVFSNGALWLIIGVVAVAVGTAAVIVVVKKKKEPAETNGTPEEDLTEEDE